MSLESEAATDKEARAVLADMLEASGDETLARWWRSELIEENNIRGLGSGNKGVFGYSRGQAAGAGYYNGGSGLGGGIAAGYSGIGDGFGAGHSGFGRGEGSW